MACTLRLRGVLENVSVFLGILLSVEKLFWGSWEVTFGAGSFIVALPMLVLTVPNYYDV